MFREDVCHVTIGFVVGGHRSEQSVSVGDTVRVDVSVFAVRVTEGLHAWSKNWRENTVTECSSELLLTVGMDTGGSHSLWQSCSSQHTGLWH